MRTTMVAGADRAAGRPARVMSAAAALAVTLPIVTSACSASAQGEGQAASPGNGGTLRLAVEKEPECLDPHQSPTEAARLLTRPLVDSLVRQDAKGVFHPWLATRWTISPDRLTYTFQLRTDVTFTDGERFDAAAVVANLEHVVAPSTKSLLSSSLISAYRSSRATGEHAVEVKLARPDSGFLGALALPNLGMESPKSLRGSAASLCARIVGSGPFRSDGGLVPQKGMELVRNPAYNWAPESAAQRGPARLDRIEVRVVPDDSARFGALTSGQVDAITGLSPLNVKQLRRTPGFTLHSMRFPGVNFSYWPNTARGPLGDVNVRRALRCGINWAQIVKNVYFGVYDRAAGVLSTSTPGYDASSSAAYAFDPATAGRLLDQAGWTARDAAGYRVKNGRRLTLRHLWSDGSIADLAVQIQAAAKGLGIEMIEQNVDEGTFVERLLAGDYDLIDTSFSHPGPEVLRVLFDSANIPTPARGVANNMARYDRPAVQAAFDRALKSRDQSERDRVYGEIQRMITDDAAVLPIYTPLSTLATRDGVRQVGFTAEAAPDFYATWLAR